MAGESVTALQGLNTPEDIAAFVTTLWTQWDGRRDNVISRWREIEAYRYATDTNSLPNAKGAFTHTTHVPELAHIAQDLEAILLQVVMPHEDWFTFEPMDSQAARKEQRKAIVSYLKNRHALNGMRKVVEKLRSDYVTYGNSFVQVFHHNSQGYIGPKARRISPYDIAFDPTGASFEEAPKIIREVVSLGELFKRSKTSNFREEAVSKLLKDRSSFSQSDAGEDKNEQYVPLGFGTYQEYLSSGFIELLWFYGDVYDAENGNLLESKIFVTGDGELLLEDTIKTASGKPHIYQAGWQALPDNLWCMGPLDNTVGLNYQINHRENAKSEALDKLIYADKVYVGDVEEMYDEDTGQTTFLAPEGGGVNELSVNTQFFSFDLHIDRLAGAMRSAARLPGDITGFRSPGEKTLGEVTALTEGGMRAFIDKAADFEEALLEKVLIAEVEIARDNFGSSIQVPSKAEEGFLQMINITKQDLEINGVLVAKGARRFSRKNQILASLTQLSGTPLAQLALPHTSGKAAAELMGELLEVGDTGLFEENAQIIEQGESQQVANMLQQELAMNAAQPSLQENLITQQLGG